MGSQYLYCDFHVVIDRRINVVNEIQLNSLWLPCVLIVMLSVYCDTVLYMVCMVELDTVIVFLF